MGIKDFKKLDIRGYNGNKIAFISALKLCRTKLSQRLKNVISYYCKKLERNKMVAGLLAIFKHRSQHRKHKHQNKYRRNTYSGVQFQYIKHCITPKYGYELGTQKACHAHCHCRRHVACQRLHKGDEP